MRIVLLINSVKKLKKQDVVILGVEIKWIEPNFDNNFFEKNWPKKTWYKNIHSNLELLSSFFINEMVVLKAQKMTKLLKYIY